MSGNHNSRAASPPPGLASSDPEVEQLLGDLQRAARAAGIGPEDPLAPLLATFACLISVTAGRNARSDHAVLEASRGFVEGLQLNEQVLHAQVKYIHSEANRTRIQTTREIGAEIAQLTEKAQTQRARVLDRNSMFTIAGGIVVAIMVAVGGGYGWGRSITTGEIDAVVGDVHLSLGNRLIEARALAALAERNPLADEIHACASSQYKTWTDAAGRSVCAMSVYLDQPPVPLAPPSSPSSIAYQDPPASAATSSPAWVFPGAPPTGPVKFHQ